MLIILEIGTIWQLAAIPFILICLWRGRKQSFIVNPYYLVIPTFISYALYTPLMGARILTKLQINGNLLIIACLLAIILGFITIEACNRRPILNKKYNENFWVILCIGLIPTVASLILVGNPMSMEGENVLEAKSKFTLPIIGQLAYFLQASIIVACKNNRSKQIIFSIVLSTIIAFITLTKTAILMTVLFIGIGLIRFRPKILRSAIFEFINKRGTIIIPIILVVGFMFNNSVRKEAAGNHTGYILKERPVLITSRSDFAEGMYLNYMYFCSPWGNMQYNLNRNHNEGDGANSFAQFGKKLGIKLEGTKKMQPSYLNTHSFITDFYLDFGYIGAVIASYILGCIIFLCYRRFGLSNDALLLSFYALISYATVMLFFSNHFTNGYLLNYFITFGGYYLVMHRFCKTDNLKECRK